MVTLDLTPEMPTTQRLVCRPLALVSLVGQINPRDVLKGKRAEVTVIYWVFWAHVFRGMRDGTETTFRIAHAVLDETGAFKVSLPDFTQDEVISGWKDKVGWGFQLREVGTGNIFATFKPTESENGVIGVPVLSSYPEVVNFTAVPN